MPFSQLSSPSTFRPHERLRNGLGVFALAWLLAGCGIGKDAAITETSTAVPDSWNASSQTAPLDTQALTQWWTRFRDPALNELEERALAGSPDIRTAYSRVREYRARRGVERAQLFPSIDAGASARVDETRDNELEQSSGSERYSSSLDLSWEIDLFGRQRQNLRAAGADLAQQAENYYGTQVTLSADVAEAYITLRQTEEQLAVTRRTLETRGETTQLTQWREQAGEASALETQQALSTLEQARAQIPSLEQTVLQTRNQLALLCGLTPGALDELLAKPRGLPAIPAKLAVGIPAETLRQRPDVRAAQRAVEAANARLKAAQRERLPSLNLTGSIGTEALTGGDIFSPQTTLANLAGSLTAPIFDAGRIGQNIQIQDEALRQALIDYERTVLTALSEVENALIAIRRTAERVAVLERAAAAARLAENLAQQQYTAGQVDLLVVLEAQRTLLSLEEQLVSARGSQANAHIQLYRALGGGWR